MKWFNSGNHIEIVPPRVFHFHECLAFLSRSEQEILHNIHGDDLYKLLKIDDRFILCILSYRQHSLHVEFPMELPSIAAREKVVAYINEWFDLDKDLAPFYKMAEQDNLLAKLVSQYEGLRIVGIPDLFEALAWAVIGQQINLTFAYTLKKRFTEHFGQCITFEGDTFWLFPTPERIATLSLADLKELQFSAGKAEYIIDIARRMRDESLTKAMLQKKDYDVLKTALMEIRGVGNWTADYVIMKCFRRPNALPIADVGLHNALKLQLGLEKKPSIEEIKELATNWEGWQSYATFYLWRSLYDKPI
ncbi:DNA-3-methyladenine glycosylase [Virgibacillus dakarensis]|nr:DNA-3-methyladenine glycosylase [Virgibacillus dakarensis]